MFFGRRRERQECLEQRVEACLNMLIEKIVDCGVCGCMITKRNAVKGEKEIRMRYDEGANAGFFRDIP